MPNFYGISFAVHICRKSLEHKHLRQILPANLVVSTYALRVYVEFLEYRTIPPNAVHYPADTVQTYTLAHMLNKRGRVAVTSNQPPHSILHLNGHWFPFSVGESKVIARYALVQIH